MPDWDVAETAPEPGPEPGPPRTQRVLVVIGDEASTVSLPHRGRLTIGRAPENDVRIEDALASRVHAAVHVGDAVEIEDLGSANGTRLGGERLDPRAKTAIEPGTVVEIGSTMIVFQMRRPPAVPRRLCAHGFLEARLDEECALRYGRSEATLALVWVAVDRGVARADLEAALTEPLGARDLVASYAPGELELLVLDASPARARAIARDIEARFAGKDGRPVRCGVALYPKDGVTAQQLIARAREAVHGGARPHEEEAIVAAPAMIELYRVIDRLASAPISVLLLGETGVGKEVVAEAIHARSSRRARAFVRINCAALSESLIEAELFGYEKGAFTGADRAKAGLMEEASGGTLFFDEVGELPLHAQAKLLRAIEEREVMRVGSVEPRPIDVRIVSATNRNLEEEAFKGRFRRDLFFRLNGVSLEIPPLRERQEEIEPLARMFAAEAARKLSREPLPIARPTLDLLRGYAWPGNVRELKNVIDRAVVLATGQAIEPIDLPFEKLATRWTDDDRPESAEDKEMRGRIVAALDRCAGNQTRAAEMLGFSRQTLSRWLDRLQIRRPRKPGG